MISAVPLLSFRLREKMPMSPADPSTPSTCRGDMDSDQLTSILMGNNPVNQLTRYPYTNPKFFANNPIGRRDLVHPYGSKTNHPTTFSSKEVKEKNLSASSTVYPQGSSSPHTPCAEVQKGELAFRHLLICRPQALKAAAPSGKMKLPGVQEEKKGTSQRTMTKGPL